MKSCKKKMATGRKFSLPEVEALILIKDDPSIAMRKVKSLFKMSAERLNRAFSMIERFEYSLEELQELTDRINKK
jgi:hypothetical protein